MGLFPVAAMGKQERRNSGCRPWEMTGKIWAPLLGLAAKGDEKAERGFGFHGEEGGRRKGSWLVEIRELGSMQMWSSPFGAVAGGIHGCWPSRGVGVLPRSFCSCAHEAEKKEDGRAREEGAAGR